MPRALNQPARLLDQQRGPWLGIESEANYCFPKSWPEDREQRARIICDWLQTEARYLA